MVMSDSEIEDNENTIVESKVADSDPMQALELQPTAKRKGSFLGFLSFIFSLVALSLSSYMYYTQHFSPEPKNDKKDWQQPLIQLQLQSKNNTDKVQNLTSQIATMKAANQSLSGQLNALKNTDLPENTSTETYDDSQLKANMVNLQSQVTAQSKQLSDINQQQTQALTQFKQRYEREKTTQSNSVNSVINSVQKQKIISQDLIASYLLAAHKYLNISGNVVSATKALTKAINKLNELSDDKFQSLIEELKNTASELNLTKKVDVFGLNRSIDALEFSVNKLSFNSAQQVQEKQSSSWYDNLVKIKKIDDKEQKLLTQSEQSSIRQSIKLHFDLLRSALINQDLGLWISEIGELTALIKKHFTKTQDFKQDSILRQLNELKSKNINPSYPDLSHYLKKFNALLNTTTEGE